MANEVSKLLSLVLRHQPAAIGIELDNAGWVDVDVLLAALASHGTSITQQELRQIVLSSEKQRFALSDDGSRIRANQGHSVAVDLGYLPAIPPPILYHGTAQKNVESILMHGLRRGERQHVHLSITIETANAVGQRHGKVVVCQVASGRMHQARMIFYLAPNGVWLTDSVPPDYLTLLKTVPSKRTDLGDF